MDKKAIFRTRKELLGIFAHNIVRQSPILPSNIFDILEVINTALKSWNPQEMDVLQFKDEGILKDVVHMIIFDSPLITDLNKSQAERDGKYTPPIHIVSRFSKDDPYNDFVDLDALERNILVQIIRA